MPRPIKTGLDYFPLDIEWDEKMELLIAERGSDSIAVMITIWQLIYKQGYYIENGDDLLFMIRRRTMLDVDIIQNILTSAITRGLFDELLYKTHNILTSRAIQKRYFSATHRREEVNVDNNYLLVGVSAYNNLSVGVVNAHIGTQRKGKESKEEESTEKYITDTEFEDLWKTYAGNSEQKGSKQKAKAKITAKLFPYTYEQTKKAFANYARSSENVKKGFVKQVTTFLNGGFIDQWIDMQTTKKIFTYKCPNGCKDDKGYKTDMENYLNHCTICNAERKRI